ncbi:uncharacterized protein [Phyllobates terribilis]|uniref:uncharacterized protein n=1 Tax=Phyllobates terribilis TaxID=111132 RepID=UPI003CCA7422
MSSLDAEGGLHHGRGRGEYKNFIQTSRDRLLYEMLQSTNTASSKAWKVLIMDKVTVRVMSSSCKMSDITDQGISLVEELFKRREPMPSMDAIYYMQPTKENMVMFLSDMSGREPLYRKAFIFFSGPVPKELVNHIKSDSSVVSRIAALREMNMEYFPIESQVYVTDHDMAIEELYGASSKDSRKFDLCINTMAMRIATVFASLKELPRVRYRAAKEMLPRQLVPSKLASAIWDCIEKYMSTIQNYPQTETCDLLIIDRSVDQIAPVIHEWTYDAMCHDLLEMEGNKYAIEVPSKSGGPPEKKEVILDDTDLVWLEIRNLHIAEASERLSDKFTTFQSKNKAAQLSQAARDGGELSTRDLQKMVQDLPQYTEMMEKLSAHVEIAGKINSLIGEQGLRELGQLEQDLVFGDAAAKDVITYFRTNQDISPGNKLRLLMIYACVHPDKFDADKASKLMQLAKLSAEDMKGIKNMMLLAHSSNNKKKTSGGFSLKFDAQKRNVAARKDRDTGEEEAWALSRFYPMLEELIEKIDKGTLGKDEFECMNEGGSGKEQKLSNHTTSSTPTTTTSNPSSRRSRRTANWGRSQHSDDGSSSDSVLKNATNDLRKMGQRIFIFIIGGATRSEIRVCHKLTTKLRREVVMGTTTVDDPPQYITKLKLFSEE